MILEREKMSDTFRHELSTDADPQFDRMDLSRAERKKKHRSQKLLKRRLMANLISNMLLK